MKKILMIIGGGIILSLPTTAQNEEDALRYSENFLGGTARYNSMGGAFGALGGDISTLSTNPAGIGVFRKSEFTFTPVIYNSTSNSSYMGSSVSDTKYNFNVGNIGWVATFDHGATGWISSNFGIGYNKLANYHSRSTYLGTNNNSSLIDIYVNQLNGDNANPANISDNPNYAFGSNLAWETYLVDVDTTGGENTYFGAIPNYGETQRSTTTTSGSLGETFFSYGANWENKLYIGGSVGIQNVRYFRDNIYTETVAEGDTSTTLQEFTFNDRLRTSGIGYNFKFGLLYRAHDFVRIGAAVHSPTFFSLNDNYSTYAEADFDGGVHYEQSSPNGTYFYRLTTPFKAIGSIGFVFAKYGLISADYEFVDYTSARLYANDYDFIDENNNVQTNLAAASNIKVGTEWKARPFSFRAGYAMFGNPYSSNTNADGARQNISLGLGIKEDGYFIDFAYVLSQTQSKNYPYNPAIAEPANINTNAHSIMCTVGLRY